MGLKCDKRHNEEYSFLSQVTYLLTFSNWKGAASELHKLPIFFGPFQKQKSLQEWLKSIGPFCKHVKKQVDE